MREKRRGNCLSPSLFLLLCLIKRRKERKKESVARTLSSVSFTRVVLSVVRVVPTIARKAKEERKTSREKYLYSRDETREKMNRKTRTHSLNTSCSISTKTIPTASKPNAHKQRSTCTLGVFEIESPRKAENAIRRRSKENIVGLFLFSFFSVFCRESVHVLFFFAPVSYFPLSLITPSLCI